MLQWFIRFSEFAEFSEFQFHLGKTALNTIANIDYQASYILIIIFSSTLLNSK